MSIQEKIAVRELLTTQNRVIAQAIRFVDLARDSSLEDHEVRELFAQLAGSTDDMKKINPALNEHSTVFFQPVPGLKPCPHCGGQVEMRPLAGTSEYVIACKGPCPFTIHAGGLLVLENVVQAWNTRAAQETVD